MDGTPELHNLYIRHKKKAQRVEIILSQMRYMWEDIIPETPAGSSGYFGSFTLCSDPSHVSVKRRPEMLRNMLYAETNVD